MVSLLELGKITNATKVEPSEQLIIIPVGQSSITSTFQSTATSPSPDPYLNFLNGPQ